MENNEQPYSNIVHNGFDKTLVIITYVLMFFTAVIGPLIVWVIKKDDDPATEVALRNLFNYCGLNGDNTHRLYTDTDYYRGILYIYYYRDC